MTMISILCQYGECESNCTTRPQSQIVVGHVRFAIGIAGLGLFVGQVIVRQDHRDQPRQHFLALVPSDRWNSRSKTSGRYWSGMLMLNVG